MIVETVIRTVCEHTGTLRHELLSPMSGTAVLRARDLAVLLLRERTGASSTKLGAWLKRDHTSILVRLRKARERLQHDDRFRADYDAIATAIDGRPPVVIDVATVTAPPRQAMARPALVHHDTDTPEIRRAREAFADADRQYLAALHRVHPELAP